MDQTNARGVEFACFDRDSMRLSEQRIILKRPVLVMAARMTNQTALICGCCSISFALEYIFQSEHAIRNKPWQKPLQVHLPDHACSVIGHHYATGRQRRAAFRFEMELLSFETLYFVYLQVGLLR